MDPCLNCIRMSSLVLVMMQLLLHLQEETPSLPET